MNYSTLILCALLLFVGNVPAQNTFGEVGSYWIYDYHPHDGNGYGWDMISVDRDTLINNEVHRVLQRTFFHTQTLPPNITSQGTDILGIMRIVNDSVFINNQLRLDFNMQASDSMMMEFDVGVTIQLAVDSIRTELIDGVTYKKWYGQKLCVSEFDTTAYEAFEILEGVGQIGHEYLAWNTDGCAIGGGTNSLVCYRNGDFRYPSTSTCDKRLLSSNKELEIASQLIIAPNPANAQLEIISPAGRLESLQILDLNGRVLLRRSGQGNRNTINLEGLSRGMYLIEIRSGQQTIVKKIIKL